MATFQRARTAEQRAERTAAILEAARHLLAVRPQAEISLQDIARQAGLAPSNVLRYLGSREGVLLALVLEESSRWLDDLVAGGVDQVCLADRCAQAAAMIAIEMANHQGFCELISVQAAVLERNVDVDTAVRFKTESVTQLERLAAWLTDAVPELADRDPKLPTAIAARSTLVAGALWAQSKATERLAEQLVDHPQLTPFRDDFVEATQQTLELLLKGAVSTCD